MKTLNLQTKFAAVDAKGHFSGLASVFGNVDLGGDIVLPGAFLNSIAAFDSGQKKIQMLWQHNSSEPIGVWNAFRETEEGLEVEGELLLKTQRGAEARELMKADILGLSIGYELRDSDFDRDGNRLIKEVDLWEVSAVTFPMNPEAVIEDVKAGNITARLTASETRETLKVLRKLNKSSAGSFGKRAFERKLHEELGFSKRESRALASKGYGSLRFGTTDMDEQNTEDQLKQLAREIRSYQL